MTLLTIAQLLEQNRLCLPNDDAVAHLFLMVSHASACGRLDHLVERINYICPREDECVVMNRDGRSTDLSMFWQQYTIVEIMEARGKHLRYGQQLSNHFPDRRTYHGGLIYRPAVGDGKIEWTVHT